MARRSRRSAVRAVISGAPLVLALLAMIGLPGAAFASSGASAAGGGTVACGSGTIAFSRSSLEPTGDMQAIDVSFGTDLAFSADDASAQTRVAVESVSSSDAGASSADWSIGTAGSSGAGYAPRPPATTTLQLRAVAGRSYTVTVDCDELGGAYTNLPFHASD